jgi:phage terminase small subunit
MALTLKRRQFVEEYLRCWNASEAARRAGYKGKPNVVGPRLLAIVSIQNEVKRRIAETAMSADEVLLRLADQARSDIGDFIKVGKHQVRLDLARAKEAGLLRLVKSIRWTKYGPVLELYDAQAALALLGKHQRLFVERHEHSGPGGGPIVVLDLAGLSDDDLARMLANLERASGAADPDSPGAAPAAGGGPGPGTGPAVVDDPASAAAGAGTTV